MADPKVILPYVLIVYLLRLYLRRRRPLIAREPFVSRKALHLIKTQNPSPFSLQSLELQNPNEGFIYMTSDQNFLCTDLINARLKEISPNPASIAIANPKTNQIHEDHGIPALKMAVARYITLIAAKNVSFEPSRIVITAGVESAIEILTFCVAEAKGDAILVPSPYNPCYDKCIRWRSGAELVPVPCRSSDGFELTATALNRTLRTCKSRRLVPRAILISNPCNPTGKILHRETLLMLLNFALDKQIHVICDETQAASLQSNPDEFTSIVETQAAFLQSNPDEFTSIVETLTQYIIERVHVVYDLGIPGFNVGAIYTSNDRILAAAKEYARRSPVSLDAQILLAAVLMDPRFVEKYVKENRRRVRERFGEFNIGLQRAGVRCVGGGGGVYCWGEMERLLKAYSEKGEVELWKELVREVRVYASPGCEWHCIERGWFRWCFGSLSAEEMAVALRRIQDFIHRRSHRQGQGNGASR